MSDGQNQPSGDAPKPAGQDDATFSQKFNHSPVAARVPDKIGKGTFSTGALVLDGPGEFVMDFIQNLARPHGIVSRVIVSPLAMTSFVNSLKENFGNFTKNFGAPQPLPKPPTQQRPTIQELYDYFKLPEEMISGVYANAFIIAHGPSEFAIDFITGFFPTAAVSARIYLPAQQIPRLLDTLQASLVQHQQRFGGPGLPPPQAAPPQAPPPSPEPHG